MSHRKLLNPHERASLLSIPTDRDSLIAHYTFTPRELEWINSCRGDSNRLGFAVHLAYMKFPGVVLASKQPPEPALLAFIGEKLGVPPRRFHAYAEREPTRRVHVAQIRAHLGVKEFDPKQDYAAVLMCLETIALRTDKGVLLARAFIDFMRKWGLLVPSVDIIESICANAVNRADRSIDERLTKSLSPDQKQKLDQLLIISPAHGVSGVAWLRQPPGKPTSASILTHIRRLNEVQELRIAAEIASDIHPNRLQKLARVSRKRTIQHLRDLEPQRRYATMVAEFVVLGATLRDEIVELNDQVGGNAFARAKRQHQNNFLDAKKTIHENLGLFARVGRALLQARRQKTDALGAVAKILPWDEFEKRIQLVESLTKDEPTDFLPLVLDSFPTIHRYFYQFSKAIELRATPAAKDIYEAVQAVQRLHENKGEVPDRSLPKKFIKGKWRQLVITPVGINLRYYELCAMFELRHALRSGDISVVGSRQFKDFEEYLIPRDQFAQMKKSGNLPLAVETDFDKHLNGRIALLHSELKKVDELAKRGELPDVTLDESGLKISPLKNAVPVEARNFSERIGRLLPRVKITGVLLDVERWTGFSKHFTHQRNHLIAEDKKLLLTAILSEGINLGLTKMAAACPGTSYDALSLVHSSHLRDETFSAALAELVNAQRKLPAAQYWGDGTTSSSDGQWFPTTGRAFETGNLNPKYGTGRGITFYSHISDQYGAFYTKPLHVNVGARDSTHVLDGLLYHESELVIKEHHTDTAGFTEHVFAVMSLLGFKFSPWIRNLADMKLYLPPDSLGFDSLGQMVGGRLDMDLIKEQGDEILRFASSIKQGHVTASLILRKLTNYPRQNRLAAALNELGRLERTLFTLEWLQDPELRRRSRISLNKGEAKNALSRAVCSNRNGEIRDRTVEAQRHRASGLNLVVQAIVLWNTVYLTRALESMRARGIQLEPDLLRHLSPIIWEHVNLTGDYVWRSHRSPTSRHGLRPLRKFR